MTDVVLLSYRRLMARRRSIHETLRDARVTIGLRQKELAALLGLAPRTVARWEAGETVPQGPMRTALVAAIAERDSAIAATVAEAIGVTLPAPPAPPVDASKPPPPSDEAPTIEALQAAVYLAADALGVPAAALRPVLARFLLHLTASRISLDEARARLRS
ncbi:helix-turn-helix domain-containing protein [Sandaracinus amylolyticus]|uniref:helix-turn-helix domain-containing protein n=1 Tax=Sandaracinus amylolyticus TaxID=927083 RepID=UPI001F38265D|nr:helix-turn-helix domain-containing protein [Sandaracinus amylolyticus]UJR86191.1 Hypothetical protein I5071_82730 [Sandaracinus amylolyticus]